MTHFRFNRKFWQIVSFENRIIFFDDLENLILWKVSSRLFCLNFKQTIFLSFIYSQNSQFLTLVRVMDKNSLPDILSNLDEISRRNLTDHVKIVEVGPRDGLQNEKNHVPTELKVKKVFCQFRKKNKIKYHLRSSLLTVWRNQDVIISKLGPLSAQRPSLEWPILCKSSKESIEITKPPTQP